MRFQAILALNQDILLYYSLCLPACKIQFVKEEEQWKNQSLADDLVIVSLPMLSKQEIIFVSLNGRKESFI